MCVLWIISTLLSVIVLADGCGLPGGPEDLCAPGASCVNGQCVPDDVCPISTSGPGICVFDPDYNCVSDRECAPGKLCCSEGCGKVCKDPCPQVEKASLCTTTSIEQCSEDSPCPGGQQCCPAACGGTQCVLSSSNPWGDNGRSVIRPTESGDV